MWGQGKESKDYIPKHTSHFPRPQQLFYWNRNNVANKQNSQLFKNKKSQLVYNIMHQDAKDR